MNKPKKELFAHFYYKNALNEFVNPCGTSGIWRSHDLKTLNGLRKRILKNLNHVEPYITHMRLGVLIGSGTNKDNYKEITPYELIRGF